MTENLRAVGYVRVSTDEQAREGFSLDAQRRAITAFCDAHGWELLRVYEDAGISGKATETRDGLLDVMRGAEQKEFDRVVFLKLDRLSRRLKDMLSIYEVFEKNGVEAVSIQEGIGTNANGRFFRNMIGTVAEFEREIIVERIKVGIREKATQGELVGPLPLGYVRDSERNVVVDPVTSPLVREAFDRYATGAFSLRDMTRWAADVGLKSKNGNPLDRLSLRKILANVSYTGRVAYYSRRGQGATFGGKHPAIVDARLFEQVQDTLTRRQRNASRPRPFGREPYPLSGTAVCSRDGSQMIGIMAGRRRRRYMRCSIAQRRGRSACAQRMTSAELLEAQLANYIDGMRLPASLISEVVAELQRRRHPLDDGVLERRRLERELQRLKKLFRWGDIQETEYKREASPLKSRLAELERPQAVVDVERAAALLEQFGNSWHKSDRGSQRRFVQAVFESMEIQGEQLLSITPKPEFAPFFLLDRRERFAGDCGVVWLPGQDSNLQPIG